MSRGSRVRSPPGVSYGACSVMVIIGASQALDPGSIPGRRKTAAQHFGALAQSEECALCKREVRGSKPRCSILVSGFTRSFSHCPRRQEHTPSLDGRAVQGARLKFESLRRRGFESHSKQISFQIFFFFFFPVRLPPLRQGHWSSGMILL